MTAREEWHFLCDNTREAESKIRYFIKNLNDTKELERLSIDDKPVTTVDAPWDNCSSSVYDTIWYVKCLFTTVYKTIEIDERTFERDRYVRNECLPNAYVDTYKTNRKLIYVPVGIRRVCDWPTMAVVPGGDLDRILSRDRGGKWVIRFYIHAHTRTTQVCYI